MIGAKSKNIRYVEVVSNIPEQMEKIANFAKEFETYYYIYHNKDKDADGSIKKRHIHCIVYDKAGTSLGGWISRFSSIGIPANLIEIKNFPSAAIKYLTHETAQAISDGKHKYSRDDVITNKREKYLRYFQDSFTTIPERLNDFQLLKTRKLSVENFVEKYRVEIDELNFYQQMRLFGDLHKYGL